MKKVFIENLGCAKNQSDAETILLSLTSKGWSVSDADSADLIIINTCGFIKQAKEESLETLFSFRKQYPDKKILFAGCLAQRYGDEFSQSLTEADAFFGNKNPEAITDVVDDFMSGEKNIYMPEEGTEKRPVSYPHGSRKKINMSFPGSTYVKIAEGCSNNCSYCAIPLIRGSLHSRKDEYIVEEIKSLLEEGFFEINLIAQDLASYGNDTGESSLKKLLQKISGLRGNFWIRLLYMHPDHFDESLAGIFNSDKRFVPYFDIPFQHASEKRLSRMGRAGNTEVYLGLVEKIRNKFSGAVIRSTFLAGFPGENSGDYRQLRSFIKDADLDWAGFFQYSREDGTRAYDMGSRYLDYFSQRKAAARVRELQDLQTEISEKRLEQFIGREFDILTEERIEETGIILGRAYFNAPDVDGVVIVHDDGMYAPGEVVKCRIVKRNNIDLEAVPVSQ